MTPPHHAHYPLSRPRAAEPAFALHDAYRELLLEDVPARYEIKDIAL